MTVGRQEIFMKSVTMWDQQSPWSNVEAISLGVTQIKAGKVSLNDFNYFDVVKEGGGGGGGGS